MQINLGHKPCPRRVIWDEVRLPGVKSATDSDGWTFTLPRGGSGRIVRAAFEGKMQIADSSALMFLFHSPSSKWLRPDIIRGDSGFPNVLLRNSLGMYFRFSRGNIKDFFDATKPNVPQVIQLPVSAFVYDREMRLNIPDDGTFFDHPVTSLIFDFLCHPLHEIDIHIANHERPVVTRTNSIG